MRRPHFFVLLTAVTALVSSPLAVRAADAPARAADAPAEIAVTIDQHRFQPAEIRVKAGAPFVLSVTNKDTTAEEFESKELRIEKVIPGGKTAKIRVRALKPGTYPFVGEHHEATAKGRIVAE